MSEPRMYFPAARTCGIGQSKICGLPAVGAIAVHPISDALDETPLTPGIVYLCERHFHQPFGTENNRGERVTS